MEIRFRKRLVPVAFTVAGLAVAAAVIFAVTAPTGRAAQATHKNTVAMGAVVSQSVYGDSSLAADAAADAAAAVTALEQKISWRIETGAVARLNAAAGSGSVALDGVTASLLQQCLEVAQASDGAFDPCILPVSRLWDFDAETFTVPDAAGIAAALDACSWKTLSLSGDAASLSLPGSGLDLGGIGKGAACDQALGVYRSRGVPGAVIAVGGSVGVWGAKEDGSPWTIAVRDPDGGATESLGTLSVASGCVSTSGTYEKQRTDGETVYHHILDPRTGYPADTDLVSVTVMCESGALSDALATACIVLGRQAGAKLLDRYGVSYLMIDKNHAIYAGGGAERLFTLTAPAYRLMVQ